MKRTLEMFLQECLEVHGDRYDYSLVNYTKDSERVEIICKAGHPPFWQKAYNHKRGTGCPLCGIENCRAKRLESQDDYITKVTDVHAGKYSYAKVNYNGAFESITVTCDIHGDFSISADAHKQGRGCAKCGTLRAADSLRGSLSEFIDKANSVHNNKYLYSNISEYVNCKTKLPITCKVHGDFMMGRNAHLIGQGCPKCQVCGYNQSKAGTFYILISNDIVKVGITNRDVKIRLKDINKSSNKDFKVYSSFYYDTGSLPYQIEQKALKWLRFNYQPVTEVFDGSTECFLNVDLTELLSFIHPLIQSETIVSH